MPDPHERDRAEAIVVGAFSLDSGEWYEEHTHDQHQLIWARAGVLHVRIADSHWVLPTSRALWVPAGVAHSTGASTVARMLSPYVLADRVDVPWTEPTPIVVDELLGPLIAHLATDLESGPRERAERVVVDVLRPATSKPLRIPLPTDDRARAVAEIVMRNPGDRRTLDEVARAVGSSRRTITRLFTDETAMPFHAWQTQVRIQASIVLLAAGHSVTRTAHDVGYASPSSFTYAFRRTLGSSPSEYMRDIA